MSDMTADLLRRAGQLMERQRLAGHSIHDDRNVRNIVEGARRVALMKGATWQQISAWEMEGERDKELICAAIRVKVVFDYYDEPSECSPAFANYFVLKSNHPAIGQGSHVCAQQLTENDLKLPRTPSYEKWVQRGRPRYNRRTTND